MLDAGDDDVGFRMRARRRGALWVAGAAIACAGSHEGTLGKGPAPSASVPEQSGKGSDDEGSRSDDASEEVGDDNESPFSCRGVAYVTLPAKAPKRRAGDMLLGPPHCPEDMVFIPGGVRRYWGGLTGGDDPAEPEQEVREFCLDRDEVSAGQYAECVRAGACTETPGAGCTARRESGVGANALPCLTKPSERNQRLPEMCAASRHARAYCEWRGLRLPSRDEWLRAATDGLAMRFPWGNDPPQPKKMCTCRTKKEGPCEVGQDTQDTSIDGVRDLAANVREWVSGDPPRCMGGRWDDWPPRVTPYGVREAPEHSPHMFTCGFRCAAEASLSE